MFVRLGVNVCDAVNVADGVGVCDTNRYPPAAALVAATGSKYDPYGISTGVSVAVADPATPGVFEGADVAVDSAIGVFVDVLVIVCVFVDVLVTVGVLDEVKVSVGVFDGV